MTDIDDGATELTEFADVVLRVARELDPFGPRSVEGVVGLTGTDALTLRWIHRHPGTCASDLAVGTGLKRSNVSVAVRSLENHGLVRREQDPADGRTWHLFATAEADRNLADLRTYWTRRLTAALAGEFAGVRQARALLERIEAGLHATHDRDESP